MLLTSKLIGTDGLGARNMEDVEIAKAPPVWKSFLVGLLLLTMVLAPVSGMVLYFSPLAAKLGWYAGATMPFGFAWQRYLR